MFTLCWVQCLKKHFIIEGEKIGIELNLEVNFVQQMSYVFHHPTVRQQVAIREVCTQGRLRIVFCSCCSVIKSFPTLCHPMDHSSTGSRPVSWSLLRFMSIELVMHLTIYASYHKCGIIYISEVINISPGNLDSTLYFIQSSILHDVLCMQVK